MKLNKITIRYLILLLLFTSCKSNTKEKKMLYNMNPEISAHIVEVSFSKLDENRNNHRLPSAFITICLKNLSDKEINLNLDSIKNDEGYNNFLLVVTDSLPYIANLKFDGTEEFNNIKYKLNSSIRSLSNNLTLHPNDSIYIFFRYNKEDLVYALQSRKNKEPKDVELAYLEFLKALISEHSIFVKFKIRSHSIFCGREEVIYSFGE